MKNTKKPIAPIIICVVVVLVIAGVTIWLVTKNNTNNSSSSGESSSQTEGAKVTSSELVTGQVSDEIGYGDFSAMQTLSKAIQNGKKTGSIVSVDGIVSHKGKSYSIGENNPDKNGYIGTVFNIEDGSESDYPKDGDRITITAKVVEISPMNFQLVTLKSFVKPR